MTINPFDDENGSFYVSVMGSEQHSLRPTFGDVPDRWQVVHSKAERAACLDEIEQNRPDMRPTTPRERLVAGGAPSN